ncbi:MAG: hypothetical protein ABSF92_00500 [Candidatus Acidiferrales bacterium]|jgi:hypothetical protein
MRCDEFETFVDDLGKFAALDRRTREEALAHTGLCGRCAALKEAVDTLEASLASLAMEDAEAGAPEAVEAALREAFRASRPRIRQAHRMRAWAWGVATAAVLALAAVGWHEWRVSQKTNPGTPVPQTVTSSAPPVSGQSNGQETAAQTGGMGSPESLSSAVVDESGFVSLPYSAPLGGDEEADIVRVRMARGALAAFGLPVNAERADDLISVDFLVGDDGMPRAVRLSE